jgi:hypothetical protein
MRQWRQIVNESFFKRHRWAVFFFSMYALKSMYLWRVWWFEVTDNGADKQKRRIMGVETVIVDALTSQMTSSVEQFLTFDLSFKMFREQLEKVVWWNVAWYVSYSFPMISQDGLHIHFKRMLRATIFHWKIDCNRTNTQNLKLLPNSISQSVFPLRTPTLYKRCWKCRHRCYVLWPSTYGMEVCERTPQSVCWSPFQSLSFFSQTLSVVVRFCFWKSLL